MSTLTVRRKPAYLVLCVGVGVHTLSLPLHTAICLATKSLLPCLFIYLAASKRSSSWGRRPTLFGYLMGRCRKLQPLSYVIFFSNYLLIHTSTQTLHSTPFSLQPLKRRFQEGAEKQPDLPTLHFLSSSIIWLAKLSLYWYQWKSSMKQSH